MIRLIKEAIKGRGAGEDVRVKQAGDDGEDCNMLQFLSTQLKVKCSGSRVVGF